MQKFAHSKDFFSSPSYHQTLAIISIVFLLLIIPITVIFLGKQTNIFNHASGTTCSSLGGSCMSLPTCTSIAKNTGENMHCIAGYGCASGTVCATTTLPSPTPIPSCSSKGGVCEAYGCTNGQVEITGACGLFQGSTMNCCIGGTPTYSCASSNSVHGTNGTFAYCPSNTYCYGTYQTSDGVYTAVNALCKAGNQCTTKGGVCSYGSCANGAKGSYSCGSDSMTCCNPGNPSFSCLAPNTPSSWDSTNFKRNSDGLIFRCPGGKACSTTKTVTISETNSNPPSTAATQLCTPPPSNTKYYCVQNGGAGKGNNGFCPMGLKWDGNTCGSDPNTNYDIQWCAIDEVCDNAYTNGGGYPCAPIKQLYCQCDNTVPGGSGNGFWCGAMNDGSNACKVMHQFHRYCGGAEDACIGISQGNWPCTSNGQESSSLVCGGSANLNPIHIFQVCGQGGNGFTLSWNDISGGKPYTITFSGPAITVDPQDFKGPFISQVNQFSHIFSNKNSQGKSYTVSVIAHNGQSASSSTVTVPTCWSSGPGVTPGGPGTIGGTLSTSCIDPSTNATIAQDQECSNKAICENGSCTAGCLAPGRICSISGDMCGPNGGNCVACKNGSSTSFTISLKLQGIGTGNFENNTPAHPVRNAAYVRISNETGLVVYNSSSAQFTYTNGLFTAPKVSLGNALSCGHQYTLTVKLPGYIKVSQALAYAGSNVLTLTPIPGDLVANSNNNKQTTDGKIIGDDVIDTLDYNVIRQCHNVDPATTLSFANNTSTIQIRCSSIMNLFDYQDGGTQGDEWAFNYNLWTRGFLTTTGITTQKCASSASCSFGQVCSAGICVANN